MEAFVGCEISRLREGAKSLCWLKVAEDWFEVTSMSVVVR
jgi:hypothetical protein